MLRRLSLVSSTRWQPVCALATLSSSFPEIDLRSDTVTKPSPAMRAAMASAEVGDDVYGEDPTVNALQEEVAALLGKEAALFFPTGTMANLAALAAHTWSHRGAEVILGDQSHVFNWEASGASTLLGASLRPVPVREADGSLDLASLRHALLRWAGDHEHCTRPAVVCIENAQSDVGGVPLTLSAIAGVRAVVDECNRSMTSAYNGGAVGGHGVQIHCDGARLLNAAVALEVSPAALCADVASVSLCLSKGVGAPVGSVLAADRALVEKCRSVRKWLGGGMRQSGVVAAAALHALCGPGSEPGPAATPAGHHRGSGEVRFASSLRADAPWRRQLARDHRVAAALAEALAPLLKVPTGGLWKLEFVHASPLTNMLHLRVVFCGSGGDCAPGSSSSSSSSSSTVSSSLSAAAAARSPDGAAGFLNRALAARGILTGFSYDRTRATTTNAAAGGGGGGGSEGGHGENSDLGAVSGPALRLVLHRGVLDQAVGNDCMESHPDVLDRAADQVVERIASAFFDAFAELNGTPKRVHRVEQKSALSQPASVVAAAKAAVATTRDDVVSCGSATVVRQALASPSVAGAAGGGGEGENGGAAETSGRIRLPWVEVRWSDGRLGGRYLAAWLRDHDPNALHPQTRQRQSDTLGMLRQEGALPSSSSSSSSNLLPCDPVRVWVGRLSPSGVGNGSGGTTHESDGDKERDDDDEEEEEEEEVLFVEWAAPLALHGGDVAPTRSAFSRRWLQRHAPICHVDDAVDESVRGSILSVDPAAAGGPAAGGPGGEEEDNSSSSSSTTTTTTTTTSSGLHRSEDNATDAPLLGAPSRIDLAGSTPLLWGGAYGRLGRTDFAREHALAFQDLVKGDGWTGSEEGGSAACCYSDAVVRDALLRLRRDGLVLLRGVPSTEAATAAVVHAFGKHMRRTMYSDGLWDTAPRDPSDALGGTEEEEDRRAAMTTADGRAGAVGELMQSGAEAWGGGEQHGGLVDTAYTNLELKPHTDCTYYRDPPALQFFNCVGAAATGGATWLVDGFAVGAHLQTAAPATFRFFAATQLPFHCLEAGTHVQAHAPVFGVFHAWDGARRTRSVRLNQFRFNNDDRAPFHAADFSPPPIESVWELEEAGDAPRLLQSEEVLERFYAEYLPTLLATKEDPAFAFEVRLGQGDMICVNNHRVMHGRRAFEGKGRNMMGAYVGLDEFESVCRLRGLPHDMSIAL